MRVQGQANIWTKGLSHLDSPLLLIRGKRATRKVWISDHETLSEKLAKVFHKYRRSRHLPPPGPGPDTSMGFVSSDSPASLSAMDGAATGFPWKHTTGNVFLAFSLLQSLNSNVGLYTQDSKPKSNITILGEKKKILPALFSSNKTKCQEKSTSWNRFDQIRPLAWRTHISWHVLRICFSSISPKKL